MKVFLSGNAYHTSTTKYIKKFGNFRVVRASCDWKSCGSMQFLVAQDSLAYWHFKAYIIPQPQRVNKKIPLIYNYILLGPAADFPVSHQIFVWHCITRAMRSAMKIKIYENVNLYGANQVNWWYVFETPQIVGASGAGAGFPVTHPMVSCRAVLHHSSFNQWGNM